MTVEDGAMWVANRLKRGCRTLITPVNAAVIVSASRDPNFRETLETFDLLLADGFWAAFGASVLSEFRVPHTNTLPFVRALFRLAPPAGFRLFLFGATEEALSAATNRLAIIHPNVTVVGGRHGYFAAADELSIVQQINDATPDLLLLGMPSPMKECFIARNRERLRIPVSIGVGGLFDIWAGLVKEAPEYARAAGLEWIVRLAQEPRRLWKRYTLTNLRFIHLIASEAVRGAIHKWASKRQSS